MDMMFAFGIVFGMIGLAWISYSIGHDRGVLAERKRQNPAPAVPVEVTKPEPTVIAISVAGAIHRTQKIVERLTAQHNRVEEFARYVNSGRFKDMMDDAERNWSMVHQSEDNCQWIMVDWIRNAFMAAVESEGFECRWSYNDDLGPSKIFVTAAGRKESVVKNRTAFGFTLIELIIVLAILAIVFAVVWPWVARFFGIHTE